MRSIWRSSLYCGSTVIEIDSMEPAGRRSKRAKASLPLCSSAEKCPICGDERMDCSTSAFTGTPSNSNRPSSTSEQGSDRVSNSAMSQPKIGAAAAPAMLPACPAC